MTQHLTERDVPQRGVRAHRAGRRRSRADDGRSQRHHRQPEAHHRIRPRRRGAYVPPHRRPFKRHARGRRIPPSRRGGAGERAEAAGRLLFDPPRFWAKGRSLMAATAPACSPQWACARSAQAFASKDFSAREIAESSLARVRARRRDACVPRNYRAAGASAGGCARRHCRGRYAGRVRPAGRRARGVQRQHERRVRTPRARPAMLANYVSPFTASVRSAHHRSRRYSAGQTQHGRVRVRLFHGDERVRLH